MPGFESHRSQGTCLLAPLPQHGYAAGLLSEAADALLAGDARLARLLVEQADMPILREFSLSAMGGWHPEQRRRQPVTSTVAKAAKAPKRGIGQKGEELLYARDGWHCRYCDCRVISPMARKAMRSALPDTIRWGDKKGDGDSAPIRDHGAFYAMTASPDHVVPHCAGGSNDDDNLVTACWPCQFGRGQHTLEEFGLSDPRLRAPIKDGWDGLTRLLKKPLDVDGSSADQQSAAASSSANATEWFASFDAIRPAAASRLLEFVEGCADLGVRWSLNEVLLVKLAVGGETLNVIGVMPSGLCHIPWSIGTAKAAFRVFAETLAEGISDAVAYETPKTWTVSKPKKKCLDVTELLDGMPALRHALEALRSEMLISAG